MSKPLDKKKNNRDEKRAVLLALQQNDAHGSCLQRCLCSFRECVYGHVTGGQRPTEDDINRSALGSGIAVAFFTCRAVNLLWYMY